MRFKLIAAFINPDITDKVIKAAKSAGATGEVVMQAKGSGIEQSSFMGLAIQDKTNVVLFVVEEHHVDNIMDTVCEFCNIDQPGNGIMVCLNIDKVAGLSKQIRKIRENLKDEEL
jgi:nitrogen regulatory protein P-II 1